MLGYNIEKIRKEKKIKLSALADIVGISPGYLSDLEKGNKKNPSIEKLQAIADALKVPLSGLLSEEEKLNLSLNSLEKINSLAKEALEKPIEKITKENKIETLAAHFEGEEFTDEDVEDIEKFIKFILSKKQK